MTAGPDGATPPAPPCLHLSLPVAELPRLLRLPGLRRDGPSQLVETVWQDENGAKLAAFAGRRRRYGWNGAALEVVHGAIRSLTADRTECRLTLTGPAGLLAVSLPGLADALPVAVPAGTLEQAAIALARGAPIPALALGAPSVAAGRVTDALAEIVAHLAQVLQHWAARCPDREAVHQARVATRRLRSALSIFKRAAPWPDLPALSAALKECASRLGEVRDWDVFLAGTGAALAAALPDDPRCATLLRAGEKRAALLRTALRDYLDGPAFRRLQVALAGTGALRPWEHGPDSGAWQQDSAAFAALVLAKRAKRVRHGGRGLRHLPIPALHELRKDCKRLRYAAEFFAPLFPHRHAARYGRRLAALQEALGLLNDTAAVPPLLAQLGRTGRGAAGGLAEGFAAASSAGARARIVPAWSHFRGTAAFWDGAG